MQHALMHYINEEVMNTCATTFIPKDEVVLTNKFGVYEKQAFTGNLRSLFESSV